MCEIHKDVQGDRRNFCQAFSVEFCDREGSFHETNYNSEQLLWLPLRTTSIHV